MEPAAAGRVLAVVVSGLLGLMVGSFLNVVVYRLPRGMSVVQPGSHCPGCGTPLGARDNVPVVSWLALRGRCRHCRQPISPRYPLVELATAASFVGLALAATSLQPLPSLLLVTAALLAASAIDADGLDVPPPVVVAGGLGAASLVVVSLADGQPGRIGWAALGAVLAGAAALPLGRPRGLPGRVGILAVAGWSAGWLWPPGGPLLAVWVVATWVVALAAVGPLSARRAPPAGAGSAGRREVATLGLPLAVVALGGFGLLLAGAVLG